MAISNLKKQVSQMTKTSNPQQSGDIILPRLHSGGVHREEHRCNSDYIHVSSLVDPCVRQFCLASLKDVHVEEKKGFSSDQTLWAIGNALQNHVTTEFIRKTATDMYLKPYGVWVCKCGRTKLSGYKPIRINCKTCNLPLDIYQEFCVKDDEYKIIGNPDLLFTIQNQFYVTEIKSIAKTYFNELEEPQFKHVIQALIYHRLLERSVVKVANKVIIFYVCKDFEFKSPYKEFHVNPQQFREEIDDRFEKSLIIKAFRERGKVPKRTVCEKESQGRTRGCPLWEACFARS